MGILFGFISFIGWGAGDLFGVFASRKIGAYRATTYVYLFGFILASLYIPFALPDLYKITLPLFIGNFLMGTAYLMGNFLLNEGFKRSNVSVVGVSIQSFPVVILLLSALIFKDKLTPQQLLWSIIIFCGVFLCTINFSDFKNSKVFTDSGIRLALIASLIFSIYFTFLRIFSDTYGWFWPNYISFLTFPVTLFLIKKMFKIKEKIIIPGKKVLFATLCSAILLRAGDIAFNYGIGSGFSAVVAPLAGASPTLFITVSSFLFKDPISQQQKIGTGLCLIGIVLLSFFAN